MSYEPVPQRLSDADRDVAVEMLREHFAAGRLDQAEFDTRLGVALAARFAGDLADVFRDLPDPRPPFVTGAASTPGAWDQWTPSTTPPSTTPVPWTPAPSPVPAPTHQYGKALGMAQALLWPVAIMMFLFGPGGFIWIIIAIIGSIVLRQLNGTNRTPPPSIGR